MVARGIIGAPHTCLLEIVGGIPGRLSEGIAPRRMLQILPRVEGSAKWKS